MGSQDHGGDSKKKSSALKHWCCNLKIHIWMLPSCAKSTKYASNQFGRVPKKKSLFFFFPKVIGVTAIVLSGFHVTEVYLLYTIQFANARAVSGQKAQVTFRASRIKFKPRHNGR